MVVSTEGRRGAAAEELEVALEMLHAGARGGNPTPLPDPHRLTRPLLKSSSSRHGAWAASQTAEPNLSLPVPQESPWR
jgi:hypothetical protein